MRVLLLCDVRPNSAATITDHLDAIEFASGHAVHRLIVHGELPLELDLEWFDAMVLHYSLAIAIDESLSPVARYRIRHFRGLKAVFLQDEYRWVECTLDALDYMRVQILFSCLPEGELARVYSSRRLPHLQCRERVLTGYVPERLLGLRTPDYAYRPVDVGYRARRLSAVCGTLGREKHLIAEKFEPAARAAGLTVDISCAEHDRLYGEAWIGFVQSCKAMLGTESGASVMDYSGLLAGTVAAHEAREPDTPFERLRELYFPSVDGEIRMNQISPRCFESAALRTLMVLYEGEYSGILVPWRHYVPLRKDHGNQDEVIAAVRDHALWVEITELAYREVAANPAWSYAAFGRRVGQVLNEAASPMASSFTQAGARYPDFGSLALRQSGRVRASLRRTRTLTTLHVLYERHVLRALQPRTARRVDRVIRASYHRLVPIWSATATRIAFLRRRRPSRLPFRCLWARDVAMILREIDLLEHLREFGACWVARHRYPAFALMPTKHGLRIAMQDPPSAHGGENTHVNHGMVSIKPARDDTRDEDGRMRLNTGPFVFHVLSTALAIRPELKRDLLGGPERDFAWILLETDSGDPGGRGLQGAVRTKKCAE